MFIVGLTGGIGTGKSTVAEVFINRGIPVIDADKIARKVVEPGTKAWTKIKAEFGSDVFNEDGTLNRSALGDLIFNDIEKRKKLNALTHPEIFKEMMYDAVKYLIKGYQYVVMDLPLLFETGSMINYLHKIIVVTCDEDQQLSRLMDRNSMESVRAKARIAAQMPLEDKCKRANFVIDNSGSMYDTQIEAEKIVGLLNASKNHWKLRTVVITVLLLLSYLVYKIAEKT